MSDYIGHFAQFADHQALPVQRYFYRYRLQEDRSQELYGGQKTTLGEVELNQYFRAMITEDEK